MLCDCSRRLPNASPETPRHLADGSHHIFFGCRFRLLRDEQISRATVLCTQKQHVAFSQTRDRSVEHSSTFGSLANLARDVERQWRPCRLCHEAQHLLNAVIRNETQKG